MGRMHTAPAGYRLTEITAVISVSQMAASASESAKADR